MKFDGNRPVFETWGEVFAGVFVLWLAFCLVFSIYSQWNKPTARYDHDLGDSADYYR
jgi:hypothetical protein